MPKSHEKFHSRNGKRLVLVVDDELINREILKQILQNDYEVLEAADGLEALAAIRTHRDTLSLVLLDLLMPQMSGFDVLREVKGDPALKSIPVIVMTADQSAEVECLSHGAIDFIPKPYDQPEVILARMLRTIELSEDRQIIQSTERDSLTGLYNREYFFSYAEQFDHHHRDMAMDAIVVDVNHFHMINERYGKAYGDEVLRRIGERVREIVRDSGGIVCRREGDTFLVYCPHREDYRAILEWASVGLAGEEEADNRVRLRMGVYSNVDKSIDMERRFDRAKLAADTVRGSFTKPVAFYDSALHESEIYSEQLLEDFPEALRTRQFLVYYQPKFDIRPEIPVLTSAEALVRWKHPRLGMISPGVFIPLFEDNGLIQQLDHYVWREAAAQIRDWKERFGISVPVSVNVSRIDMYDPNLIDIFRGLMEEYGLTAAEYLLEITESAYTQDSEQIIDTVNQLRALGFRIEMDDFGTGYSSLNMISTLPIDALKLDMQFIRNAFRKGRDTRMLEVIIDIADYLSVPVIAEGVETEEQLHALKAMGCDIVQGYYFSRPVPPEEYERFVEEKRQRTDALPAAPSLFHKQVPPREERGARSDVSPGRIAHALSSGFESIYYVDTASGHYVEFSSQGRYQDLQIQRSGSDFFGDTQENLRRVVYRDDQDRVSLSLQKDVLLAQLTAGQHFSMTYRLLIGGSPVYYHLKAVKARTHDDHHIVIGVSNVNEAMLDARTAGAEEHLDRSRAFFSIAQALSCDFESIYYVDTETGDYTEFTAQGSYETLQIELSGTDFFTECQKNLRTVVYEDDQPRVSAALQKDALLGAVADRPSFVLAYRLVIDGAPVYYQLKAVRVEDDEHRIVIGVSNVDAQVRKEREYESTHNESLTYASIAQALAADYFSIYYVDTETDRFIEYSSHDEYQDLNIEKGGEDFFNLSRKNILRVVHPEDHDKILDVFTKERLLRETEKNGTFTLTYRLMFGDKPTYVSMKATRMTDRDDKHIVIGVNSIDAQMERQLAYEKAREQSLTYSRIAQALAADYFSIYYVDTETDRFIEYSSHDEYQDLNIEKGGEDFFNLSQKNILRVVHPEDHDKILDVFTKERLLRETEKNGTFTLTYRLMFGDKPTYVSLKATRMTSENDDTHIVIGVSNVDAQMKREEELGAARAMANRDALTGVKSKHAFVAAEADLNHRIGRDAADPFAIAVCDLNGLKHVNDTMGHKAGDKYIQDASSVICNIFKHSPVFRIGGDEFVAILHGPDYDRREALVTELAAKNRSNAACGGVIIACGLAEYRPGQDRTAEAVFERADAAMYDNKTVLKADRD